VFLFAADVYARFKVKGGGSKESAKLVMGIPLFNNTLPAFHLGYICFSTVQRYNPTYTSILLIVPIDGGSLSSYFLHRRDIDNNKGRRDRENKRAAE
jgi:hypothetical protein